MNKITLLLTPGLDFLKNNLGTILIIVSFVAVFLLGYRITSSSLKKLKYDVFSYYPFDKFFPNSGSWSIVYFLITIILLGALVYAIVKGGFYLGPA